MVYRTSWIKRAGILLFLPLLFITTPFSGAGTVTPLGAIVASGYVTIGNNAAPTGTTLFAGDRVTSSDPVLINFDSGSRVEMTGATANFARQGNALVVQVDKGLLRFNFHQGEQVQINAGDYRFTTVSDGENSGELGLNPSGQIAMNVIGGAFEVLNTATGRQTKVTASSPFAVMDQSGQGNVIRNGQLISDSSLKLAPNELRGKCIVTRSEAYAISGNSASEIAINGKWGLGTGKYAYKVVECTEEALISAGASEQAAKDAVVTSVFGVSPAPAASHTARNVAIIAGVGGGVAIPVAIKVLKEEKSPSSR